jgi:ferrochelatase
MLPRYDALLVVSFGGPESPDEVLPFLENVLRGRNVPRERMLAVAEHYLEVGGRSPINEQNRALIAAIERELAEHGPQLPVYWGNRNWHPLLPGTLRQMAADGIGNALAFVTSAFSSYSGCRQYRENIAAAQAEVGPSAPRVDKLRVFFNHPGFIEPMIERTRDALAQLPSDRRADATLVFTAHSIPAAMAANCDYENQLGEACRLVAGDLGRLDWHLVYQSRSGPPGQPWLEPDVNDFLRGLAGEKKSGLRVQGSGAETDSQAPNRSVVVVPIGFISDHMEVVYDLDTEVGALCRELGMTMVRAATVGTHPRFVRMIRELILERMTDSPQQLALGDLGPHHDVCPEDCCLFQPGSLHRG